MVWLNQTWKSSLFIRSVRLKSWTVSESIYTKKLPETFTENVMGAFLIICILKVLCVNVWITFSFVIIAMEAMDQLLMACHAPALNLFVESFLKMVQKLLESTEPQLQILATQSVCNFKYKCTAWLVYFIYLSKDRLSKIHLTSQSFDVFFL